MIKLQREANGLQVTLQAINVRDDLNVVICGGDKPHIGAVAVAQPRPSLLDAAQASASTSVITVMGHKEDLIAHRTASQITAATGGVTTVSCGVHIDHATPEQIKVIDSLIQSLTFALIEHVLNPQKLPG